MKVSYKKKNDDGEVVKKYVHKKPCNFFETVEEAMKAKGSETVLNMVNEQIRLDFAKTLSAKLKNHVDGTTGGDEDIEDLSDEIA